VLELEGALAAHAVEVIPRAGMLRPRMTTLMTFAQPPEQAGSLPPLPTPFQKATHGLRMPPFRIRSSAIRVIMIENQRLLGSQSVEQHDLGFLIVRDLRVAVDS
jgi:hypothetical protein